MPTFSFKQPRNQISQPNSRTLSRSSRPTAIEEEGGKVGMSVWSSSAAKVVRKVVGVRARIDAEAPQDIPPLGVQGVLSFRSSIGRPFRSFTATPGPTHRRIFLAYSRSSSSLASSRPPVHRSNTMRECHHCDQRRFAIRDTEGSPLNGWSRRVYPLSCGQDSRLADTALHPLGGLRETTEDRGVRWSSVETKVVFVGKECIEDDGGVPGSA